MLKFNNVKKFVVVFIALLVVAGVGAFAAEKKLSTKEISVEIAKTGNGMSTYDYERNTLNKSITFKKQHEALMIALQQKKAATPVSTSTKTVAKSSAAVNTAKKSSSVAKANTANSSSTKTRTSIAKASTTSTKTSTTSTKTSTLVSSRTKLVASRGGSSKALEIVDIAMRYLGAKYVYGEASPSTGFDCSGFTMYVYSKLSVSLPHSSTQQYNCGTRISSISSLKPGDLVFFYTPISHVGIYIGNGQFIHASNPKSGVKITSLSDSTYKREFVGGVRIFN